MFKYIALETKNKNDTVEVGVFTDDEAHVLLTSVKAYNQAGRVLTNQEVLLEPRGRSYGPQNEEMTHNIVSLVEKDDEDSETVPDYSDIEV